MMRRRTLLLPVTVGLAAAVVTLALPGVTYALWHTEIVDTATIRDAAVLFAVDGEHASSAAPAVDVPIGKSDLRSLLTERRLAKPIEVVALSQGNRGLRYSVELPAVPAAPGDTILGAAELGVFRVADAAACTVDLDIPASAPSTSTPVPATYSDSAVPEIEHWCLRADLGVLPDEGRFTSTTTITGAHALGELVEEVEWDFAILTRLDAADEPPYEVTFTYETFRTGGDDAR
jgi:hypothetical protein